MVTEVMLAQDLFDVVPIDDRGDHAEIGVDGEGDIGIEAHGDGASYDEGQLPTVVVLGGG